MAEENRRSLLYGRDDNLGGGQLFLAGAQAGLTELSSRPERTRISYFASLATKAFAALLRESRMQPINAIILDRKSGVA